MSEPKDKLQDFPDEAAREAYVYETLAAVRRRLEALGGSESSDGRVTAPIDDMTDALIALVDEGAAEPEVFAALLPALREANRLAQSGKKNDPRVRRRSLARFLEDMADIAEGTGRYDEDPIEYLERKRTARAAAKGLDVARVQALVTARAEARAAKDWAAADAARAELDALGVEVHDDPTGSTWSVG